MCKATLLGPEGWLDYAEVVQSCAKAQDIQKSAGPFRGIPAVEGETYLLSQVCDLLFTG